LADLRVQELVCVELDALCIAQARDKLEPIKGVKRVELIHGDYAKVDLPSNHFDAVVCLNVLEHIDDDVAAVEKAYQTLAPAGRLILYVPAFPCLLGEIDRRLGHFRRYRRDSLRKLLLRVGLNAETIRYYNMSGFFGWWVRFRLLKRDHQSRDVVGLFDRLVFPAQSRIEAAMPWLPFGQSLFAVATKPE
jgi:SAM-dependent methyltransferase